MDSFYQLPGKEGKIGNSSTLDSFIRTYSFKPQNLINHQLPYSNTQNKFGLQNAPNNQNDPSLKDIFKQRNPSDARNGEVQNTNSALNSLLGGPPVRSPLKLSLKKKQTSLLDILKKKDFKKKPSFEMPNQPQKSPQQNQQMQPEESHSDQPIRQQQQQQQQPRSTGAENRRAYISKEEKKRRLIESLKRQKNQKKEMSEEERSKLVQQMVKNEKDAKMAWKKKMDQERELRIKALANNSEHVEITLLGRYHQTNEKQAHNLNPLINHLVSYDYGAESQETPAYRVPNDFASFEEYRTVFEPLMLNEYIHNIKSTIQQAIKGSNSSKSLACKFRIHTLGKEGEPTYIELKEKKDSNTDFVASGSKDIFALNFAKNYMILISKTREIDKQKLNNFMNPNEFYFVGFLSTSDQKATDVPKAMIKVNPTKFQLKFKNDWHECYIYPLDKITTMIREFFALKRLEFSDVCSSVLRPQMVANIHSSENYDLFEKFFKTIKGQYNESQFESIKQICLSTEGISLLQGPPGTGKTHTLLGIVSGLAHYLKNSKTNARKHIMICAPSNTAIDEIIMRICTHGLYDEYGKRYKPNLVRIGILDRNPPEIVRQHSIEYLAQQEINKMKNFDKDTNDKTIHQLEEDLVILSQRIEKLRRLPDGDKKELEDLFDKRRNLYTKFQDHLTMRNTQKEKYNETVQRILFRLRISSAVLLEALAQKN